MFVKWLIVQTFHQTCFSSSCFSQNHHLAHFFAFASLFVPFHYCLHAFILALQAIMVLDGKIVCKTFDDLHFSFFSNMVALLTCSISVRSLFSLHCCQNHNLTCKCNSVNVLLIANACPILFVPSSPILLNCEWLISVKSVFLLHCCQNHNLTPKCNSVNVLLVANACPIFFAPSSAISLLCECLISVRSIIAYCCQNHNLTFKCNFVNVLLIANAWPIQFAPSAPILFSCERMF